MHAHQHEDLSPTATAAYSADGNSADRLGAVAWDAANGRHPLVAEIERLKCELAAAHDNIENLEIALRSSREIGAAIGVLMARRRITAERAFDLLRERSQHAHRKLRDIAADVLFTGSLDQLPPR